MSCIIKQYIKDGISDPDEQKRLNTIHDEIAKEALKNKAFRFDSGKIYAIKSQFPQATAFIKSVNDRHRTIIATLPSISRTLNILKVNTLPLAIKKGIYEDFYLGDEALREQEEKEDFDEIYPNTLFQLAKSELLQLKPISEQFDKDISEFNQFRLKDASGKYEEELKDSKFSGKGYNFQLGTPSTILQKIGMPKLPITVNSNWISSHILNNPQHNLKTLNLKGLVEAIHNPIAILQDKLYSGENGRIELITTLKGKNGKSVNVLIEFRRRFGKLEVNAITTAFEPKDSSRLIKGTLSDSLLYVDKERITDYLQGSLHIPNGPKEIVYPKSISDSDREKESLGNLLSPSFLDTRDVFVDLKPPTDSSTNIHKFLWKIKNFNNNLTDDEVKFQKAIATGDESQFIRDVNQGKFKNLEPEQIAPKQEPIIVGNVKVFEHGEDTATKEGILNGHKATNLTEEGKTEAFNLGQDLVKEGINKIIDSGIERAIQTAEIASNETIAVEKNPLFKTWNMGDLEGRLPEEDVNEEFFVVNENAKITPNAETFKQFRERALKAWNYTKTLPSTTAIITHSKVQRLFDVYNRYNGEWNEAAMSDFLFVDTDNTPPISFNEELERFSRPDVTYEALLQINPKTDVTAKEFNLLTFEEKEILLYQEKNC